MGRPAWIGLDFASVARCFCTNFRVNNMSKTLHAVSFDSSGPSLLARSLATFGLQLSVADQRLWSLTRRGAPFPLFALFYAYYHRASPFKKKCEPTPPCRPARYTLHTPPAFLRATVLRNTHCARPPAVLQYQYARVVIMISGRVSLMHSCTA